MPGHPLDLYRTVEKATLSGRELEANVLNKAAQQLLEAQQRLATAGDVEAMDSALRYNQRVWTLLQSELEDPANPLPNTIKSNLVALVGFIDRRTFSLMAEPVPERMAVLIDINRTIAGGLQGNSGPLIA